MKVLVVDDSEVTLKLISEILTTAGLEVEVARDGLQAINRIREGEIRLIVSDWAMPNMSGLALCRAVRTEPLPGYVYIILLTSHATVEDRVAGLSVGADDFLPKPFDPAELIARVRAGVRVLTAVQK